ncbi:uncharacterized protein LOC110065969 isoform X2 [Orbicella faveolata]|uniref:uncharacterized protein LOC110065969 isoform X2 n=1 Tax=Orbicella faveolata TaxID=48498 RepID=UPI0009E3DAF3|nr:uncharacterized protein LOC110065969 isoform X2 [Orbicella faveolata]
MYVWRKLLFLLAAIHEASGTWVKGPGIKYYLATCGRQNCDSVCGTFGFQCARTGQSFPPTSALWIFQSLGISCKSFNSTDYYTYQDSPNYVAESPGNEDWVGVCLGFKSIPSTIDCHTANNTYVRRLCPCYDPSVTQQPVTTSLNLSTPTQRKTTSTTTSAAATTAASTTTSTGEDRKTERTALIVVAVIAAGLVICLLSLAFLLMWKRRQLRGRRNKKQDSEKLRVGYHKSNNKMAVPDMIDGLTVVADIEEENSYCDMKFAGRSLPNTKDTKVNCLAEDESYENTFEQVSENILYSSVPEGTNMAFAADNNIPLYDRLA